MTFIWQTVFAQGDGAENRGPVAYSLGQLSHVMPDPNGEQAFRFNNREIDDLHRFIIGMKQIVGRRLTYAELTGKQQAAQRGLKKQLPEPTVAKAREAPFSRDRFETARNRGRESVAGRADKHSFGEDNVGERIAALRGEAYLTRSTTLGVARCGLMDSVPFCNYRVP